MKLKIIGPNQTELKLSNGTVIFFSYETPVVAYNLRPPDLGGFPICKTNKQWSKTTSRHISGWVGSTDMKTIENKDQEFFDNLADYQTS